MKKFSVVDMGMRMAEHSLKLSHSAGFDFCDIGAKQGKVGYRCRDCGKIFWVSLRSLTNAPVLEKEDMALKQVIHDAWKKRRAIAEEFLFRQAIQTDEGRKAFGDSAVFLAMEEA